MSSQFVSMSALPPSPAMILALDKWSGGHIVVNDWRLMSCRSVPRIPCSLTAQVLMKIWHLWYRIEAILRLFLFCSCSWFFVKSRTNIIPKILLWPVWLIFNTSGWFKTACIGSQNNFNQSLIDSLPIVFQTRSCHKLLKIIEKNTPEKCNIDWFVTYCISDKAITNDWESLKELSLRNVRLIDSSYVAS